MDPTSGKMSALLVAAVLTFAEPVLCTEVDSEGLGSMATRPGRVALKVEAAEAAETRGRVEELGEGGARIADREEKALRTKKVFMLAQLGVDGCTMK